MTNLVSWHWLNRSYGSISPCQRHGLQRRGMPPVLVGLGGSLNIVMGAFDKKESKQRFLKKARKNF
jgi:hypothetical protein